VRGTGTGGSPEVGRAIPRAARLPRPCRRAARLLLAGEDEALTRKAVELALAGDRRHYGCALNASSGPS
jgi:hypothetical protein